MAFIYQILRVGTDQCYVGHSSMPEGARWKAHRYHLNKGTHHAPYLQRAWAKLGAMAFSFEKIEDCEEEDKLVREQYYMDNLNSCFNGRPAAASNLGLKYSEEARERMRIAQRNNLLAGQHRVGVKETVEQTTARLALAQKGMDENPFTWITDGILSRRLTDGDPVPDGWNVGRTLADDDLAALIARSSGPRSEAHKSKLSAAKLTTWKDPSKRAAMMNNRRPFGWWTDGTQSKRVPIGDHPPEDWSPGRAIDGKKLVSARATRPIKEKPEAKRGGGTELAVTKAPDQRPDAARLMLRDGEASRRGQKAWDNPESAAILRASRSQQCWITDGVTSQRHSKSEPIPDGWRRGRTGLYGRAAAKAAREALDTDDDVDLFG